MLAAMNVVTAQAGQVVFVPAVTPHAIGPGVMLTELQEPTSFSVLAEHSAFGVSGYVATLGLGWDLALSCFDLRGRREQPANSSPSRDRRDPAAPSEHCSRPRRLITSALSWLRAAAARWRLGLRAFAVLVVAAGAGEARFSGGRSSPSGETWVAPYGAGPLEFAGEELEVIVCLPPVQRLDCAPLVMFQEAR